MDMACSTHLRTQKFSTNCWLDGMNRGDPLKYLGVDCRTKLKWILRNGVVGCALGSSV